MKLNKYQFLDLEQQLTDLKNSAVAVLPFPYQGGVSYGRGTAMAPEAVIKASHYLELYDEVYCGEFVSMGISTLSPPTIPQEPEKMAETIYLETKELCKMGKFVAVIGGDHSISSGFFRALQEEKGVKSVIQLDAHSDLRDSYEGSPLSHASVMARIREMTENTLQIGIRSMSLEEAEKIEKQNIQLITMHDLRTKKINLGSYLEQLPDPVFVTLDVDVLDWSVVSSTGTPEPGGLLWHEMISILETIFFSKNVSGFDIVELSYKEGDLNSPFAVAKLLYKMIVLKFLSEQKRRSLNLPPAPAGPVF